MSRLKIRSLLAINILGLLLACVVLITGMVCLNVNKLNSAPTRQDFEDLLATKIGGPYSTKIHETVSYLIDSSNEQSNSTYSILHSYGDVGLDLGIDLIIISSISVFIIAKSLLQKPQEAEQAVHGNPH